MMIRTLVPGDEEALEAFLVQHKETSMFLRANVRQSGLVDRGQPREATYVAAFEEGDVVSVAAHAWNGMLLVQAPRFAAEVARASVAQSGRDVVGISGPFAHVAEVRAGLDLASAETSLAACEKLFTLDLAALCVPAELTSGKWICRKPRLAELDLLAAWRAEYSRETLGVQETSLHARSRSDMERMLADGSGWVVTGKDDVPRAYSGFNARLPDVVQIGGVWTPPPDRGQGLARAAVAGSLLATREAGVRDAILFTQETNLAAQRAYVAIGFREIGTYGLVLFR